MSNVKFQNALARKPQKVPPIWFMRQAGRYHQHYQNLKKQHTFMELCKVPELAAEVAWGPVQDFDFDVAILFSDLLFPLEGLGMGLTYGDGGPELGWHLRDENLSKLLSTEKALDLLQFQKRAVEMTRAKLPKDKSLIGFVGGPWTLYVYAVEGSHAGNLIESKKSPRLFRAFESRILEVLEGNIALQLAGGAEIVMIFDTAAGELSPRDFSDVIVPGLRRLANRFPQKIGYYSKGTQPAHLRDPFFAENTLAGIGVDHRWDLRDVLATRKSGFVQGNFDQALLHLQGEDFRSRLEKYIKELAQLDPEQRAGWVSGLGHGVLPKTPEENVRYMVKRIREALG